MADPEKLRMEEFPAPGMIDGKLNVIDPAAMDLLRLRRQIAESIDELSLIQDNSSTESEDDAEKAGESK